MHEIEQWIEEAVKTHGLGVSKLPKVQALELVSDVAKTFVNDRPRAWWLDLRMKAKRVSSDSLPLSMVVPKTDEHPFFIPETEDEELPVFRGSVAELERLICECPFFEYYVVAPDKRWVVIESDHNEYFLCGDAWDVLLQTDEQLP